MADLRTALFPLHVELGARMVPFAGYEMPVQYPTGVLKEHLHTRESAGLFDVSHMGQIMVSGAGAAAALEQVLPIDVIDMPLGQQRYGLLTNDDGGIQDDCMVAALAGDRFFVVVNAGCKDRDFAYLQSTVGSKVTLERLDDRSLLALQGPKAWLVLQSLAPQVDFARWLFMTTRQMTIDGLECLISRSGYTGEDGFEISVPSEFADRLARRLLADERVRPIGLGARDSLRLEAGLCLYGHDIDTDTTPIAAALTWSIPKVRREGPRSGGFPGSQRILSELGTGPTQKRVGLLGQDRTPVREGTEIWADGRPVGKVTSGTFSPTLGRSIAMAYLDQGFARLDQQVFARVRGKDLPMTVSKMPFVPNRYFRG